MKKLNRRNIFSRTVELFRETLQDKIFLDTYIHKKF